MDFLSALKIDTLTVVEGGLASSEEKIKSMDYDSVNEKLECRCSGKNLTAPQDCDTYPMTSKVSRVDDKLKILVVPYTTLRRGPRASH